MGEIVPEQGQRLGIKTGIWCSGARAGSGIGYQGLYETKCDQDKVKGVIPRLILREVGPGQRVRDWVPRLDEMVPGQGPGLCTKARMG